MGVTGRSLCWALNLGALGGALAVVASQGWDLDGDGALTVHEALLVLVRLLAFPVHLALRLAPAPLLHLLGVPDVPWPTSAAVAIAASLPLWGLFVVGGLAA